MKIAKPRHENDCVAAVIASLLELPINKIPDFWQHNKSDSAVRQYQAISRWLRGRGWHYYYSDIQPRQMSKFRTEKIGPGCSWPPRGYWIGRVARVEWLRDCEPSHVVVMKDRRCVYNPGAKYSNEVYEDDVWLVGYYLLVPLDPVFKSPRRTQ